LSGQNPEHKWINHFPEEEDVDGLLHRTYYSEIHQTRIGYTIALPKDYSEEKNINKKYPELFNVSIAMAGGYQWEKQISEARNIDSEYQTTDNSWDLAKKYAKNPNPPIKLYVLVGREDENYESNIAGPLQGIPYITKN